MLVMTRRPGDTISIGDRIVVRIVDVKGGKVQIGVEAPRDVKVVVGAASERPETGQKSPEK